MSLTLAATVGSATANSYLTVSAAQGLLDGVPNTTAWDSADDDAQAQALVYATTLLGAVPYQGVKAAVSQALAWPRQGVIDPDYGHGTGGYSGYMMGSGNWGVYLSSTTIPVRVQRATALLALEILRAGTSDVWGVDTSVDITRKVVGPLQTDYAPLHTRRLGLRRYPSVWREIAPLSLATQQRTVERA